ncbi:MAG: DNA-binding protein [Nakamurella multipartita]|jgi:hypothetical protein
MTNSTEQYTAATTQAREVTERGVEAFKKGAKTFTDQATAMATLPSIDLTEPVARYFDLVQKSVDMNRELATRWAEHVSSLSGLLREQAEKAGTVVDEATEAVSDQVVDQAAKADELAQEQAEQVEQAKRDEEKAAKAAERAEAKKAKEQAREQYEGLTKAELSEKLAERELPKTGTVEELIERLVSADSK